MGRICGVLFDKDGTLFDFHATWGAWADRFLLDLARGDRIHARRLGQAVGFDMDSRTFMAGSPAISGTPGEIAEVLLEHLPGANPQILVARINVSAAEAPLSPAAPLDALLGGLRGRGLRLGVATNDAEAPARAHLQTAGIADLFDFIAGSDSGHGAKPDPGMLLAFCDRLGLDPRAVVMVGDSAHDLIAGRAAGMRTVAVLTGHAEEAVLAELADTVLADVGHLPVWLDREELAESVA
ncbi:MAG: HAD family hydrolase [Pseudomonadota bacterium]